MSETATPHIAPGTAAGYVPAWDAAVNGGLGGYASVPFTPATLGATDHTVTGAQRLGKTADYRLYFRGLDTWVAFVGPWLSGGGTALGVWLSGGTNNWVGTPGMVRADGGLSCSTSNNSLGIYPADSNNAENYLGVTGGGEAKFSTGGSFGAGQWWDLYVKGPNGGPQVHVAHWDSTGVQIFGALQGVHKSSDGSAGATEDIVIGGVTLHVKDGLITGHTP